MTPSASSGHKRPARRLGLVASNASYLVPEAIRKKFASGWNSHVPLQYLTDKFCGLNNGTTAKALNDLFTMDGSSGTVVSVAKELPFEGELTLTFDEWFQAWQRLLQLIQEFVPEEYQLWLFHYESILQRPMRAQQWPLCLAYDSRIRRLATVSPIDPSEFHLAIWNELETGYITNTAIQTLRADLGSQSQSHSNGHSFRANGPPASNPNHLPIMSPNARCFVCGNSDPRHSSRRCHSTVLVNGKDAILIVRKDGEPRRDSEGNSLCFAFNGRTGCTRGANCEQGKHWCSLCGQRNGAHTAQTCPKL
ncbi:hypothetical protein B0H13DRAFT_1711755 [Mycena leptocephala]|nr:hypothetical protein B0H13DRAFT_1711755 [Mycena leptocephala]